jgi:hypothetical protein
VPEVQRNLRRDGRPETHQHVLSDDSSHTKFAGLKDDKVRLR